MWYEGVLRLGVRVLTSTEAARTVLNAVRRGSPKVFGVVVTFFCRARKIGIIG
jgi:hypothetical protein